MKKANLLIVTILLFIGTTINAQSNPIEAEFSLKLLSSRLYDYDIIEKKVTRGPVNMEGDNGFMVLYPNFAMGSSFVFEDLSYRLDDANIERIDNQVKYFIKHADVEGYIIYDYKKSILYVCTLFPGTIGYPNTIRIIEFKTKML